MRKNRGEMQKKRKDGEKRGSERAVGETAETELMKCCV